MKVELFYKLHQLVILLRSCLGNFLELLPKARMISTYSSLSMCTRNMCVFYSHRYWWPLPVSGLLRPGAGVHRFVCLACRPHNPHFEAGLEGSPSTAPKVPSREGRQACSFRVFLREHLGAISVDCPFRPAAERPNTVLSQANVQDFFGDYKCLYALRA